jgi:SAM-dependent methyltransferase
VAERLAPEVTWHRGLAEALPFPDDRFDRVVSQFGLMFVSNRMGALREALRVLRPGGGLAFVVFAGLERNPAYADEVALLERTAGRAAADALRAPFVLGDAAELLRLAERAGVAGPEVRPVVGTARFPSVRTLVEADLRGWLPVMGIDLDERRIASILAEAEVALERYVNGAGEAEFAVEALLLSGTRAS